MSLIFSPAAAATDNTAITTTTINTSSTSNPTTGSPTTADPATNDPNTVDRPTAPSYALAHSKPLPNLPPELWLEIIPRIPYSPSLLPTLRLTHPNLTLLTSAHQQTLTSALLTHHFPSRTTLRSLFPDLKLKTYAALATLYTRLQALDALGGKWLQITSHGPDLHWLKGKWEGLHRAGLLLLWRLRDVSYTEDDCNSSSFGYGSDSRGDDHSSACTLEAYEKKLALLRALPLPSLACLLFKLVSCVRILRVLGPEPWFSCGVCRHGACEFLVRESGGDVGERKHAGEAELVVQECLLEHGPEVFGGLLASEGEKKGSWARRYVTHLATSSICS